MLGKHSEKVTAQARKQLFLDARVTDPILSLLVARYAFTEERDALFRQDRT